MGQMAAADAFGIIRGNMAAKKFYAVKLGKITGVFQSWEECRASVEGFPNAEYKGFASREEALRYLGQECGEDADAFSGQNTAFAAAGVPNAAEARSADEACSANNVCTAYVDGSYQDGLKKYAFGCVFVLPDGRIYLAFGNGDEPQSLQHRNVTGEMLGAMYAVRTAIKNGFQKLEICYDYQGIEKWVTGEWKSKTELTRKYAEAMRKWARDIDVIFTKVEAHANVRFNELADRTAKRGLTEACGIPKVKKWEEMELYGADAAE